jgi:hypothetical protein
MTSEVLRKLLVAGVAVAALSVGACKKADAPAAASDASAAASDTGAASDASSAASDATAASSSK